MRFALSFLLFPFFVGLDAAARQSEADQTPIDVQRINAVGIAISKNAKDSKQKEVVVFAFLEMIEKNVEALSKANGIFEAGQFSSKAFKKHLQDLVRPKIEQALRISAVSDRKSALYKLLRETSTQLQSHSIIDSWLDLPNRGGLIKTLSEKTLPRANKQVYLDTSDSRLQLKVSDDVFITDFGGPGSGNGMIDAGEWINLTVGLYNASTTPFFSSSAYISESHPCTWTARSEESLLPEMSPMTPSEEPHLAPLGAWIYVSERCADGANVPLQITVQDTHQTKKRPIKLSAFMTVVNRGDGGVYNYVVDSDEPGFSDKSNSRELIPDISMELSHGLFAPKGATFTQQNWGMNPQTASFLKSHSFRATEPLTYESNALAAGDDLDIKTKSKTDFHNAFNTIVKSGKWSKKMDAKGWFATDVELRFKSIDQPIVKSENIPVEICNNYIDDDGDGDHDCKDKDCSESLACVPPIQPADVKDLLSLIANHAEIKASKATKTHDNALSAVKTQFELLLDEKAFAQSYDCLLKGISQELCGTDPCPDCPKEVPEPPKTVKVEPKENKVSYLYRHYFSIDISSPPEICTDKTDNDLDGYVDCEDSDCSAHDACYVPPEVCDNGQDDDRDGQIDCQDSDCVNDKACIVPDEICDNGKDDDRDGKIDCLDSDCPACPPKEKIANRYRVDLGVDVNRIETSIVGSYQWISPGEGGSLIPRLRFSALLADRFFAGALGGTSRRVNGFLLSQDLNEHLYWSTNFGMFAGYSHSLFKDQVRLEPFAELVFHNLVLGQDGGPYLETGWLNQFAFGLTTRIQAASFVDLHFDVDWSNRISLFADNAEVVNTGGLGFGLGIGVVY